MKKLAAFIIVLSPLFTGINAQTITSADFGSVGDSVFLGFDETPGVSVGPAGIGQTWNFTSLNTESLDTLFFLAPSSLPNGSNFPTANLALASNEGVFFFEKTVSAIYNTGFSFGFGPIVTDVNYIPPVTYLQFPASVGTTFSTNSGFLAKNYVGIDTNAIFCQLVIDSVMVKRVSTLTVNFDASGTLQLPTGTYNNALRAYSVETTRDSIFIYAPYFIDCSFFTVPAGWSLAPDFMLQLINPNLAGVILDTNRIYTWYAPGGKFGVCAIDVDYAGNTISARFVSDASQIGLNINESMLDNVHLYPNPASYGFMIQSDQPLKDHLIQLMDLQGRIIKVQNLNNNQLVNVEELNDGIYLVQILNSLGNIVYRSKVIVQK
ncbi:MAG: T9SS type A sorting domain-containing protein [Flavobacteriales bacterium]|nr:T9SS type A sorting domain-containing protein [Flavobacteriales bacterium]